MNQLIVDFQRDDVIIKDLFIEIFGSEIQEDIIESRKFNGDIINIVATILIPASVPFLTVLFQKYFERKKNLKSSKSVKMSFGDEEYYFENFEVEEIATILREVKNNSAKNYSNLIQKLE
jgi:hypothetical protein